MDTTGTIPALSDDDPLYEIAAYTQLMKEKLTGVWYGATLVNGWLPYVGGGGYYGGLRYRTVGPNLQIQGMVKSGAAGSTIATLPVGFRPQHTCMTVTEANGVGVLAVILVDNNGNVSYRSGPTAPTYVNINILVPTP